MKNSISQSLMLAAAAMLPISAATIPATAAMAQAGQAVSTQAIAEGLLAAINGPMAERNAWARENLLRDNLYRDRLNALRDIARRNGELTLVGVDETEFGMTIAVRDQRGRQNNLVVELDSGEPGKVRGLDLRR